MPKADEAPHGEEARLIPVRGLRNARGQEAAATSALLAVMSIVPAFSHPLLRPLGAPAGRPRTFTEPSFSWKNGDRLRPDGLIRVVRGRKEWTALVEVKTGENALRSDQVAAYVRLAKREGFDAVVTISNEFVAPSLPHPVRLPARLHMGAVQLGHWSWMHLLTTAQALRQQKAVADPEQAWLLDELIRYLSDPRSGALRFGGFEAQWPKIRQAAQSGTLHRDSKGLREFVIRWDQFLRHLSLLLSGELGTTVEVVTSAAHHRAPESRARDLLEQLVTDRQLDGVLRVPNAAADLHFSANLYARRLRASVTLPAPEMKRPSRRIDWLLRQLPGAADTVQVTARFQGRQATATLGEVRKDGKRLLLPDDPRRGPSQFTVAMDRAMGAKHGRGKGSFVASVEALVRAFYHDVLQDLAAWVPPAPRLASPEDLPEPETPADGETGPRDGGGPDGTEAHG